ncbi:MAG: hypothetical protein ACP5I4_10050 [Oceanipulchritudo sp.]
MSAPSQYAIPLFSLIDREKVDLRNPLPESLGDQLALYLDNQFGIQSISTQLIFFKEEPFLVLYSVPEESLPALCSLVDVQRTQLYRYERKDGETVVLTPLNVKI